MNITCILSKFLNFQVEKCTEIMACSMEIQNQRNSSHKVFP